MNWKNKMNAINDHYTYNYERLYIFDSAVLSGEECPGDLLMKICKRCFREFDESEIDVLDISPATELADIFLRDIGVEDINALCPACREESGIMNLLGFEQ